MLKATKKAMRRVPKRKSNDKLQYTELDYACIGIRSEFVTALSSYYKLSI